jgi:NAD-dependent SIR2 family protein deacetylase
MNLDEKIEQAAAWIKAADGLLITAGAGMGVDSGLPDFRGTEGFWRAYPALGKKRTAFEEIASPESFVVTPRLAWGFYGHRLDLYRRTVPHAGFAMLMELSRTMAHGHFVYTSNIDGQFQKAGFAEGRIVECHGTIHDLQCAAPCCDDVWSAAPLVVRVDEEHCRWEGDLPRCLHCGGGARPNVLMFNDCAWIDSREVLQKSRLDAWLRGVANPVVIELGAGIAIPSVRRTIERVKAPLIRINPAAPQVPSPLAVGLPLGALEALRLLVAAVERA